MDNVRVFVKKDEWDRTREEKESNRILKAERLLRETKVMVELYLSGEVTDILVIGGSTDERFRCSTSTEMPRSKAVDLVRHFEMNGRDYYE